MLEIWTFLTAWYNLPFTALLGLSIFVAVLPSAAMMIPMAMRTLMLTQTWM